MTDKTNLIPDGDNDIIPLEPVAQNPDTAPDWSIYAHDRDAEDIDAALAAVASLSEPVTEKEAQEIALDAAPPKRTSAYSPTLPMPPLSRLKRGQLGSVIPALLLIGLGAWLTLNTTSGTAIDPTLIALVVIGGIALTLIAHWIGTGRWSRGTLLFGVMIALTFAVIYLSGRRAELHLTYPVILSFAGVALILAGVLSRPPIRRAFAPGLLLIVAGGIGLVVSMGLVPSNLLPIAVTAAPLVALLVLIILLLPRLRRR